MTTTTATTATAEALKSRINETTTWAASNNLFFSAAISFKNHMCKRPHPHFETHSLTLFLWHPHKHTNTHSQAQTILPLSLSLSFHYRQRKESECQAGQLYYFRLALMQLGNFLWIWSKTRQARVNQQCLLVESYFSGQARALPRNGSPKRSFETKPPTHLCTHTHALTHTHKHVHSRNHTHTHKHVLLPTHTLLRTLVLPLICPNIHMCHEDLELQLQTFN